MKRYVYNLDKKLYVDEYQRLWSLDYFNGCPRWTNVGSIEYLPKDFEYVEYNMI